MALVAGIDGCKGGWFVVQKDLDRGILQYRIINKISEIFSPVEQLKIIALDVPIGLPDEALPGGRECDRIGRALLGPKRQSSIFSPPVREALRGNSWEAANKINSKSSSYCIGLSQQSFGIFPKMKEIDAVITPTLQNTIKEVHPEICFFELNNRKPLLYGKKTPQGRNDRRKLLFPLGFDIIDEALSKYRRNILAEDDILDACIACWTAERIFKGEAIRIPEHPSKDSKGLRMEMWR
jgi:predicted RNase H-like nuclease